MKKSVIVSLTIVLTLIGCSKQNLFLNDKEQVNDVSKIDKVQAGDSEAEIIQIANDTQKLPDLTIEKVKVNEEKMLLLNTSKYIFFDSNKYQIKNHQKTKEILKLLKSKKNIKIYLIGHTDSKGNDSYNQILSELRAKAVYKYFLKKGINKNQLDYIGYGEEQPISTNESSLGRSLNRRVEVLISQTMENSNFYIENRKINKNFLNNHNKLKAGVVEVTLKGQTKNKSDLEIKKMQSKALLPKRKSLNVNLKKRKHIIVGDI